MVQKILEKITENLYFAWNVTRESTKVAIHACSVGKLFWNVLEIYTKTLVILEFSEIFQDTF